MTIQAFKNTPVGEIAPTVRKHTDAFISQKTKPLEFRLTQLRKLYWSLVDNEAEILEALQKDLSKSVFESQITEIGWLKSDCLYAINNLHKWMKDESIADMPLMMMPMGFRIKKEPVGTILVIGAYNYPLMLSVAPFIGAICAGCTGVCKPSEQAPASAMIIQKLFSVLDPSCYSVIQGGIPETTELLDQTWDKIFYTGSPNVGKIIAQKAAETLTPTVLELGGRNPAIITKNANIPVTAKRLLWGKFNNAGQSCISQNYHLVDRTVLPQLIEEIGKVIKQFFPNGTNTADYAAIATDRGWERLRQLLNDTKGRIIYGGKMDKETRHLDLTVVEVTDINDPLVADEHFGPLIVLLGVDNLDQAIKIARQVDPTPLTAYAFGNDTETKKILEEVRSGGATVNDVLFHAGARLPPFGGLKTSGQGVYRGKASFDAFTHRRTVAKVPNWLEVALGLRYPPYTEKNMKQLLAGSGAGKPNFDRDGNVHFSISKFLFAPFTLLSLVTLAVGIKQYLDRRAKL